MKALEFKASLNIERKLRNTIMIVLAILAIYHVFRALTSPLVTWESISLSIIIIGIFFSTTLISYFFATKSYKLDHKKLSILTRIGNKEIKISDIEEIRNVDYEMNHSIRLIGFGGLFGYFGKQYALKIGFVTVYATQRKNRILIQTTQGQKIIITPDDESSMLSRLKDLMESRS